MGIKYAGGNCQPGPFEQMEINGKDVSLQSRVGHRNTFSNGVQTGDCVTMRSLKFAMENQLVATEPVAKAVTAPAKPKQTPEVFKKVSHG